MGGGGANAMEVVVNAAMSADGKISSVERRQIAISGPEDFDRVDRLRASVDAVMVGIGTILADDPHLTVDDADHRSERVDRGQPPHPARIVADSHARTPPDAGVVDDAAETFLLVTEGASGDLPASIADRTQIIEAGGDRVDLPSAFDALEDRGIESVLVEGGGELVFSLFAAGLIDRLMTYVDPVVIGGRDAPTIADGDGFRAERFVDLTLADVERIDEGILITWDADGSTGP